MVRIKDLNEISTVSDDDVLAVTDISEDKDKKIKIFDIKNLSSDNMLKTVYDPASIEGDVFDMNNMVESSTKKILTDSERVKLSNQSGTNTGDQSASDFNHNDLAGLNNGTNYEHLTQTEKLHAGDAYIHSTIITGNPHNVTKDDIGLGSVDNTSDLNKPINTATQIALNLKADNINLSNHENDVNNPHNVTKSQVGLGSVPNTDTTNASNITTGTLPSSVLPPVALTQVTVVASQSAQLALIAEEGDVVVRSDLNKSYMHNSGSTGTMGDWTELQTPTGSVLSVNEQTGTVILTTGDIGEDANYRFITDTDKTHLSNLSGINTGDQDISGIEINTAEISNIKTKTDNITVTQAVDLDTMESDITTNNAKVSNATHTGEVTGSTTLTIANNVIDEANMKISNAPTDNYVLTADRKATGGWKWAAGGGSGGITWSTPVDADIVPDSQSTRNIGDQLHQFINIWSTYYYGTYFGKDGANTIYINTNNIGIYTDNSLISSFTPSGVQFGGSNARVTTILDEDDMASDSDTVLATQQSIKAYVDSNSILTGQTVGGSDGDLVYLSGDNTWSQADASAESTASGMLGIRVSATSVQIKGIYTTTGLTAAAIYYASETAGAITTTKPTIVRVIGYALSATQLIIDPSKTWIEVA